MALSRRHYGHLLFHPYASEQWKPINTEEKKKYDREFLLGFQFISASMNKPEGLPAISDVVLDKVETSENTNCLFGCMKSIVF